MVAVSLKKKQTPRPARRPPRPHITPPRGPTDNPPHPPPDLAKGAIASPVLPISRPHYDPARATRLELVSCPYFPTSLSDLPRPETLDLASLDSFVVAICIEGRGTLTDDSGAAVPVHQGETVLIPASARSLAFTPDGGMKILTSWIG